MAFESLLLRSLIEGPPLVGDLPGAPVFPAEGLVLPDQPPRLGTARKLGHLYEEALAVLLEASPDFDLLARNLQVQRDRHETLGELDFLLRDRTTHALIHLELAVKFYLVVRREDTVTLPGPDPRDHYHRKIDRLRSHQLTLTSRHRDHLPAPFRREPILTRQLITGCLFDPSGEATPYRPPFLHPEARRGKWTTITELSSVFPPGVTFKLIPKALWPVPCAWLQRGDLDDFVPDHPIDRCLMVLPSHENTPWFITPPGYPDSLAEPSPRRPDEVPLPSPQEGGVR